MQTTKKTALHVRGNTLNILKDNLVLQRDHPEGRHKIPDNYKAELFIIVSKHKDPYVYTIWPMYGGSVHMVNWWQLFDLGKSSLAGSEDTDPIDLSPKTNLPFYQTKKNKLTILPICIHMDPGPRLRPTLYYNNQILTKIVIWRLVLDHLWAAYLDHGCSTVKNGAKKFHPYCKWSHFMYCFISQHVLLL